MPASGIEPRQRHNFDFKLVYVQGETKTENAIVDELFKIRAENAIILKREVEIYEKLTEEELEEPH